MVKFKEIGTYKTAQNIGYLTTPVVLKNGYGVTYDLATKVVALPTATTAKGDVALVMNTIDKPEIKTPNDFTIDVGENPRIFPLKNLNGRTLQFDTDPVTTAYASLVVNDKLTLGTDGKWVKTADVTGYTTYLQIIELATLDGSGFDAVVVVA
jgi:hypothetical protein